MSAHNESSFLNGACKFWSFFARPLRFEAKGWKVFLEKIDSRLYVRPTLAEAHMDGYAARAHLKRARANEQEKNFPNMPNMQSIYYSSKWNIL